MEMRIDTRTQAQALADLFDNNGLLFETADGRRFEDVAREMDARIVKGQDEHYDSTRLEWEDGSAIIIAHGAAWDFVHADCLCGFCGEGWGIECLATARDLFELQVQWERDGVACFSDGEPGGPLYVVAEALDESLRNTEDPDEIAEMYARWCLEWDVSHEPPAAEEKGASFAELDLTGKLAPRARFTLAGSDRAMELAEAAGYAVDFSSQVATSSTWEGERIYAAPLVRPEAEDEPEIAECSYCGRDTMLAPVPAVDDDEAWESMAADHAPDCEWVTTRAHRREHAR